MHMRKLEGKTVLITGQQGATLLVIAQHFINEGAHVFLVDSGCPELARTFHNIQTGLTCVRGDISDLSRMLKNSLVQNATFSLSLLPRVWSAEISSSRQLAVA